MRMRSVARPAVLAWTLAGLAVLTPVPALRLGQLMQVAGRPDALPPSAVALAVVLAIVSAAAVGAVLAGRRPRHPVGWLLLGVGLGLAMNILVESYVKYGLLVRHGSLPSPRWRWWARVAAVFQPARHRVQQAVDRRFNRRRYDAAHTITAFSARLRHEVDLDTLTAELLVVVEQTVQPTKASLWLRPPGG